MKADQADFGFSHYFFLWFGAAVSMAEIITGGYLATLGFSNGILVILVGHAVGTFILILGGIIGTRMHLPSLVSTRITFGEYGSYLFSICNLLQLIGWTAVMIIMAARSVNQITTSLWHWDHYSGWCLIIGFLVCLWVAAGKTGFKRLNMVAAVFLLGLTMVMSALVFRSPKLWHAMGSTADWGMGMELNIIMPLSWLPLIADYTRFAKNERRGAWGSWLGYFIGSSWMYIIGLGATIVTGQADPTGMMTGLRLGMAALSIVILATVTTTFLDVYSAAVTFLNLFPRFHERTVAVIMGIAGTLLAIWVPLDRYQDFLYLIGTVFAPLFAILLSDFFLLGRNEIDKRLLLDWKAAILWGVGMVCYYFMARMKFILGATLPVMIVIGVINILLRRMQIQWRLSDKLLNCSTK